MEVEEKIRSLLKAGKTGEAVELATLAYRDTIFSYLYYLLEDRTLAEDMTQETFLRLWKGIRGFRWESQLLTWLITIARNLAIDYKRKKRPQEVPLEGLENTITAPPPNPEVEQVRAALLRLPDRYREALTLYYLEGRDLRETARVLGISYGAAKVLLLRARRALRRLLE